MKFSILLVIVCLIHFIAISALAETEIAPGFNECNSKTETMGQENVCWGKAIKYWSGMLEKQYAKVRKACDSTPNPAQCKERLKKMQVGWLAYSNGMVDFLKNGLLHEQEFATTTSINDSLQFEAWSTRQQYETLKMLE